MTNTKSYYGFNELTEKSCNIKIYHGTRSFDTGNTPRSVLALSRVSEIKGNLGITDNFYSTRFNVVVTNGDYPAKNFYVVGVYITTDNLLNVVLNTTVTGQIRLNYTYIYDLS